MPLGFALLTSGVETFCSAKALQLQRILVYFVFPPSEQVPRYTRTQDLVVIWSFLKNGPIPPFFLYFRLFNTVLIQFIVNKIANVWIRTAFRKRPLYQLSHNHCGNLILGLLCSNNCGSWQQLWSYSWLSGRL